MSLTKVLKWLSLVTSFLVVGCATTRPHPASGPRAYWSNVRVQTHIKDDVRFPGRPERWILGTVVNPTDEAVVIDCEDSRTIVAPHTEQDILTFPADKCDLQNDITYPNVTGNE
jgi:hypothetical protein